MIDFTVYRTATGEVVRSGYVGSEDECLSQAFEGESVYVGKARFDQYIADGTPVDMPPKPGEHHVFDWTQRAWLDPRTMEDRRRSLRERVTEHRWEIETGGITLQNGVRVLTGKPDQDRITAVIVNADIAGIDAVDFKADSGWARLTLDELRGVARAIGLHVQACFSAERTHHAAIDQLRTEAETEAYDISAGWPLTHNSIETQ